MESTFFEYRDKTGIESGSDSEIIDNSITEDNFLVKPKNRTVFVPESEESASEGSEDGADDTDRSNLQKEVLTHSNDKELHALSSSDDEEMSPEIVPKRRPPTKAEIHRASIIGRKTKKRMIILDSDTDNSIIIERNRNRKLVCMKDTPPRINSHKKLISDDSIVESDKKSSDDENDKSEVDANSVSDVNDEAVETNDVCSDDANSDSNVSDEVDETNDVCSDDDDGPDEDQMVMSRATRMSIMGVIPKDNDSDDSDFIQSDNSTRKSGNNGSEDSLPGVDITQHKTPGKKEVIEDCDTSRLSCSPFASPFQEVTNDPNVSRKIYRDISLKQIGKKSPEFKGKENLTFHKNVVNNNVISGKKIIEDDDVTIIDSTPEIIALSSDDEFEPNDEKKSPRMKKSPRTTKSPTPKEADAKLAHKSDPVVQSVITQYLVPPSYPNQVIYVKKHVRENELSKLHGLREDLQNIKYLLENMDTDTLPDGGIKLMERLSILEERVRVQGDKVASMVVEPDEPTAADIGRDGFDLKDKELTWDDIQKASNSVQPKMFGKQAMATHMAERHLILDRLRDLHESLGSRPPETELDSNPAALKTELMPHQLHALAWLKWRETQRPRGGILADDMGLGKTITMISLIANDKDHRIDDDEEDDDTRGNSNMSRGGTLVVCPASLIQQWGGEVELHCTPYALTVCLHHGASRAQQPHRLAANDMVVTTYNILQRDNEKNGVLMRILWRRVILDEAHIVRNYKSATSIAVSALKASRRWCLTGTPVHNKDLDLFALLKFLRCTPFDDLTMWKKWIDNKSMGGQERLSTIMRCVLLRRTKAQLHASGQLACLPKRTLHEQHVTLQTKEMNVYQKVLVLSKTLFAQFLHQRAERNADAQGILPPGKDSEYAKMHKKMIALQGVKPVKSHEILVLLLRLRQVCCHCGLIAAMLDDRDYSPGERQEDPAGQDLLAELNKLSLDDPTSRGKKEEEDDVEEDSTTVTEAIRSVLSPNNPVFDRTRLSSKIKAAMDCLNEHVFSKKDEKAVVVSQWTSVLGLVERELSKNSIRSVTLNGNVPVPARQPLINAINDPNSNVRVMLLSLCAGGVGLNLCGANHLLLLDPHWNPQLEEQAQDRIYRVGQTKHVHVYKFMCVGTVEQTIRKLQQDKLELAANVLTGARNTNASKLSIEDLKLLFNMRQS